MKAGIPRTDYEVLVSSGDRWTIDSLYTRKSEAMAQAQGLLASGRYDGVRITARREGWSQEKVIFEQEGEVEEKPLTITPIEDAPPCDGIEDFYGFEARRTVGRLLRHYLDEHGMTALELAFSPGHLNMLERNDTLFPKAMQRVAGLQARDAGMKPAERSDALYRAFGQIKDRSRTAMESREYYDALRERGLQALIAEVKETVAPEMRAFFNRGAVAAALGDRGDWNEKAALLVDLAEADADEEAIGYVDEALAEILDGGTAVMEILGGQPDAVAAYRMLVNLAYGECDPPKHVRSCLAELNELMARAELPLTRRVLLERVEREVGGLRPLTREGPKADREAFLTLVHDLMEPGGLKGGIRMTAAVTRRARGILSTDDTDLAPEEAIGRFLDIMPSRAVRLGYLLDLAQSDFGERYGPVVLGTLSRMVGQLTSVSSLVPPGSGPGAVMVAVAALKDRLGMGNLPEELKRAFAATLDRLIAEGGRQQDVPASVAPAQGDRTGEKEKRNLERVNVSVGEIIFEEGEQADHAYLVASGTVEIFRKAGNRERILATLGHGEIFGEMSLIDGLPRMASARTLEDTELTIISRASLQARLDRLEADDRVLRRLLDVIVNRLRGQARIAE